MHRFLKFKRSSSFQRLSFSNEVKLFEKSCVYCRNLQNQVSHRHQSTILNPNHLVIQKTRRKRSKRYNTTELLEVSNKSTLQRTTKVQTVNASNLKNFIEKNGGSSKNNFHSTEHTYNDLALITRFNNEENIISTSLPLENFRIISMLNCKGAHQFKVATLNEIKEESVQDETFDIFPTLHELNLDNPQDALLDSIPQTNSSFHPEILEESLDLHEDEKEIHEVNKTAKESSKKTRGIDVRAKKVMIMKTLSSYVETCSVQNLTYRALNAILFFQSKSNSKDGIQIDDINVYNPLLKAYASRGNVKKIMETLKMMEPLNVSYNLQTYIIFLEALCRTNQKNRKQIEKIRDLISRKMIENSAIFDEIMNKGSFLNDERELIKTVIKTFDESYEPTYEIPKVQYNNELVNVLNHEDQLKPLNEDVVISAHAGIFSKEDMEERISRQITLEKKMNITVTSIEAKEEPTEEILRCRKAINELYEYWRDSATKAFNRDLFSLTSRKSPTNTDIYLKSFPVDDFVTIIVDEAKKLAQGSETYSPTVNMLYKDLGAKVYNRYKVLRKKETGVLDKVSLIHKEYCDHYAASHKMLNVRPEHGGNMNTRQKWQWIEHQYKPSGATLDMNHREWVPSILIDIGKFLYHVVMHDLMIDVNCMKSTSKNKKYLPAFYTIFRSQGRVTKEEVKPHPILSRLYRASYPETLTFPISETPMVCPPMPWTSVRDGGYLITPTDMVRLPNYAMMQKQKMETGDVQQLYPSLDSLNQLAAVPWKVNTKILDVVLEVFNTGGSDKLDVPQPSSSLTPPEPEKPVGDMDKLEKYNFFRQKLQYRRKKAEMYSLRCDCLYRLSLAQHFRDEVFWLPHNMDFRGRVYPIPPHLNHLGSDLARSMLVFAEPRPLGPEGLNWLKIHLINLTGLKKRDRNSDRLKFANDSLHLIFDSADHPLTGKRWWVESDEPWQTLACCIEITDAIRSGDAENFKSHFPVHQDGSCNGLQHYAALGRDKAGGFSVNLCPSDVPQDVYSAVVALVEERRKTDAENGVEVAKLLDGFVKRKVIKQTIMTTVYGVTRFGARLQIAKQLKDIEEFPKDQVFSASHYLTTKTFESLRTMFTSTKEIQDWFTECARLISSVGGRQVEWVTPLGLPIVQPYFKFKKMASNSVFQPFLIDKYEKPNVMKQKNAFPPNFIHSLDSSHMMLTSLNCERGGITFVSVHDCFWTHASTVPIMNKICREQFVALHSQPILEDLSIYLSNLHSYSDLPNEHSFKDLNKKKLNRVLSRLPRTGDLDIMQVLDSVYFFS